MDLGSEKNVAEIVTALNESKSSTDGVVKVQGSWGSFGALLAGHIFGELDRPIVYICPHIDDAEKRSDDIYTFTCQKADVLPAWEGVEDLADATDQIRAERLRIALKLTAGQSQFIIPVSVQALCQAIPDPQAIKQTSLGLQAGAQESPEAIAGWLVDNSFEHVERIDLPGQFAKRGGIIDIYAPLVGDVQSEQSSSAVNPQNANAIRIEFFGDTIESIRQIDLDTHRSAMQIDGIDIVSAVCGANDKQGELFLNLLPGNTIIILEQPGDIEDVANVFFERCEQPDRLFNWQQIYDSLKKFTQLHLYRFAPALPNEFLKLDIKTTQQFQHTPTAAWAGHKQAL